MLSEDFAYVWEERRPWEEFYKEEIVNNEFYKTLFFSYKGKMYQFEPVGYKAGEKINGKTVVEESYIFCPMKGERYKWDYDGTPVCYDSFKDAVDNAETEDGKTLKDIWDDPDSEYLDFA